MQHYTQMLFIEDQRRSLERLRVRLTEVTSDKVKRQIKRQIKSTEAYLAKMDAYLNEECPDIPAEEKELEE
jgi:hypothetical protein